MVYRNNERVSEGAFVNEKLTRENIENFYEMYAAFAYRCAYKNLRDTTRAEMCVVDAFIDTYHKRAKLSEEKVIYYFSDAMYDAVLPRPARLCSFSERHLDGTLRRQDAVCLQVLSGHPVYLQQFHYPRICC